MLIEVIKRHIEDRSSYRVIAKRLRETTKSFISKSTIHNYLKEVSLRSRSLKDMVKDLNPHLTGFLHLDGKGIKLKGRRKWELTLFIAQDSVGLPVHQNLIEGENKLAIMNFLEVLKEEIKYPFRGIISDMSENIIYAVKEKMSEIPHQFCLTHLLRGIDRVINYQHIYNQLSKLLRRLRSLKSVFVHPYLSKKPSLLRELKEIKQRIKVLKARHKDMLKLRRYLRVYVLSNSLNKVDNRLMKLKRLRIKFKRQRKITNFLNMLIKYRDNIFCHLKYSYMPYTNNLLENLIKQYERRLKTMEGFGHDLNAIEGYLNLMAIYHCFKPYTDCKEHNKRKNGKAPLELAGTSIKGLDWVRFSLRTNNS